MLDPLPHPASKIVSEGFGQMKLRSSRFDEFSISPVRGVMPRSNSKSEPHCSDWRSQYFFHLLLLIERSENYTRLQKSARTSHQSVKWLQRQDSNLQPVG